MPFVDTTETENDRPQQDPDRAIGRKQILDLFCHLWGITTWPGCLYHSRHFGVPIGRTSSGKPIVSISEIKEIDARRRESSAA
jgi:hypothetical protein